MRVHVGAADVARASVLPRCRRGAGRRLRGGRAVRLSSPGKVPARGKGCGRRAAGRGRRGEHGAQRQRCPRRRGAQTALRCLCAGDSTARGGVRGQERGRPGDESSDRTGSKPGHAEQSSSDLSDATRRKARENETRSERIQGTREMGVKKQDGYRRKRRGNARRGGGGGRRETGDGEARGGGGVADRLNEGTQAIGAERTRKDGGNCSTVCIKASAWTRHALRIAQTRVAETKPTEKRSLGDTRAERLGESGEAPTLRKRNVPLTSSGGGPPRKKKKIKTKKTDPESKDDEEARAPTGPSSLPHRCSAPTVALRPPSSHPWRRGCRLRRCPWSRPRCRARAWPP